MDKSIQCWCGNKELLPFSNDYVRCPNCETLVLIQSVSSEQLKVGQDDIGLYGREYWFEHQAQELGLPNITQRARTDFTDRIPYWLNAILKYKLPPAKSLELGCSHGGLVSLMCQAGYDASGLELSPFIVEFAQKTFNIPVLTGLLEDQLIEPASLDIILMMDVLEHLPDPMTTLSNCRNLLKPDGLLVMQTPCYTEGKTHGEMDSQRDPFLGMLQAPEHIHLFSKHSVEKALKDAGFQTIVFEQAIFNAYDMFVFAGFNSFKKVSPTQIETHLLSFAEGRLVQTVLDLNNEKRNLKSQLWKNYINLEEIDPKILGHFFYEQNNLAAAEQAFRRGIATSANSADTWLDMAVVCYEKQNFPDAVNYLSQALLIDPQNIEGWAGVALVALEINEPGNMLVAYEKLQALNPVHPVLAELRDEYQQLKAAQLAQRPAAPPASQSSQADELTAQAIKAYQINDRRSAERLFLQALKISPNHFNALVSLGKLYLDRSRFNDARTYLRSAIAVRPNDADAWVGLALVATRMNDRAAFREAFQKASALEPNHPQLKKLTRWN